jgi:hypothetical protein
MTDILENEKRRAFVVWLRTGRMPPVQSDEAIEHKFNPWHDPENGRFTFAGTGRYHGRQGGGFRGGGGGFGGGGAAGGWERREPTRRREPARRQAPRQTLPAPDGRLDRPVEKPPSPVQPFNAPSAPLRTEVRNGYTYTIDSRDRTVKVSGALTVAAQPTRSRTAQARAGGSERRSSDDGGHYIAARFNGPTEAFNHFAQDANFNRGSYRALEDQWAKAKRAGKKVTVRIVPYYARLSIRPSTIDVWFTIDGHEESLKFPNGPAEKSRVKR